MMRKRKEPARNGLKLRGIPVKSFSIPTDDFYKKKKKITQNKKNGHFKNKDNDEWSTCFSSIEEMRDTALDSECYPHILPNQLSFESEKESEHLEENQRKSDVATSPIHFEESFHHYITSTPKDSNCSKLLENIQQTEPDVAISPIRFEESFNPYITSSPKNSCRASAVYERIYPRKILHADVSPIKGQDEYEHYFDSQESFGKLQPINLSKCAEIPEINEEIVIQDSDNFDVSNQLLKSVPEFSDYELPVIPEQSNISEEDWEVPVEEHVEGLDLQYQNNYHLLHTNKNNHSLKDSTYDAKELSKIGSKLQKQNSKKKSDRDSSIIEFHPKSIISSNEVEAIDNENVFPEVSCFKRSRTKSKTKNAIIKPVTNIFEFQEDNYTLKRNKNSCKSRKKKGKIKNPRKKLSEDTRDTISEKAEHIKRHQEMLKHVSICCLTTLKCSLQLQ